ncbi:MAG TPA: hypothetical protein VMW56_15290 [Candidatus Margulisiibacteriota bacterium]|nr:hypothetical protein [Candidatus Margulisiibacteriota bacterium]
MSRPLKTAAGLLIGVTLAAATYWLSAALDRDLSTHTELAELVYLPPTRFLRAVSLGYEQVLANVLWFRTISYFGRHYQSDRIYPWLASMCDVVTDLDPRAEHVYRFGGVILPWEADRVDDGIALLEKGVRNVPDSWQLQYMLGFSYYFFSDDLSAASRVLRTASVLPGAADFVSRLAASVDAASRGPRSAVDFLTEVQRNDTQEEMREVIRQRINELALSADLDSLEAAVRTFRDRTGRTPANLGELVSAGVLAAIPEEPFGGRYVLDPASGRVVGTSGHQPWRLGSSRVREAFLKARAPAARAAK